MWQGVALILGAKEKPAEAAAGSRKLAGTARCFRLCEPNALPITVAVAKESRKTMEYAEQNHAVI